MMDGRRGLLRRFTPSGSAVRSRLRAYLAGPCSVGRSTPFLSNTPSCFLLCFCSRSDPTGKSSVRGLVWTNRDSRILPLSLPPLFLLLFLSLPLGGGVARFRILPFSLCLLVPYP